MKLGLKPVYGTVVEMNTGIGTVHGTVLEHFQFLFDPIHCQLGNIKMTVIDNQNIFELIFIRKYALILFYDSEKSSFTKMNGMRAKGFMLRERGRTPIFL